MPVLPIAEYPTEAVGLEKDRRTDLVLLAGDERRLTRESMNLLKFSMKRLIENNLRTALHYCRVMKNNKRLEND